MFGYLRGNGLIGLKDWLEMLQTPDRQFKDVADGYALFTIITED